MLRNWTAKVVCRQVLGLSLLLAAGAASAQATASAGPATVPIPTQLPPGALGQVVALGRDIVNNTNTHPLSRQYVGNSLTCASCHSDGGANPKTLSFLGVASAYPTYTPREKKVITLEDRNLNCFMRSMNGTRPPNGSEVSIALVAYITWLSEGYSLRMSLKGPFGPNAPPPLKIDPDDADPAHGRTLYESACSSCHGTNGAGTGKYPPVWGPKSYNDGAGMADDLKLATFIRNTMSFGNPGLSDGDALDIAAHVNAQPRPRFEPQKPLRKKK